MNKTINSNINPAGIVYRRTFSSSRLKELLEKKLNVDLSACQNKAGVIDFNALCNMAFECGISKEDFKAILQSSTKKQFADNFIWRFLKKTFNIDLAIPFITGIYSNQALKANLVTSAGHKAYADQIGGTTTAPFTAMAYGTGAVAADAADTALGAEVARGAATVTNTTTSTDGDTEQWVYTFTSPGVQAITEEGILNNNTSGGVLLARQVFSAINMILNDTVQFTHKIQS